MEETNANINKFVEDDFEEIDKVDLGDIYKFEQVGDALVGILDHFEESKYGQFTILKVAENTFIKIGDYTALKDKLLTGDVGKKVKIVYKGEVKSKTGRMYMDFDVYKKDIEKQ